MRRLRLRFRANLRLREDRIPPIQLSYRNDRIQLVQRVDEGYSGFRLVVARASRARPRSTRPAAPSNTTTRPNLPG